MGIGDRKNPKPARALRSRVEKPVGTDSSQVGLPVREFGVEIDAFPTVRLENGPPGVRNGNRRPGKSETGTGTSVEGRVTCRN
ncbi:hypothetical protein AAC387_Pa12g0579 [Persea americana]